MSVDAKDLYGSYWPYTSHLWQRLGVNPVLIYLATPEKPEFKYGSPYGSVITIPLIQGIDSAYQAVMARFLAAAVVPGINYITDIDLLPASPRLVQVRNNILDQVDIIVPTYGAYNQVQTVSCLKHRLFGFGCTASSELFKEIFQESGVDLAKGFWDKEIVDKILAISPRPATFGADEYHMTALLDRYLKQHPLNIQYMYPMNHVANTEDIPTPEPPSIKDLRAYSKFTSEAPFRKEKLLAGEYWEIHVRRDESKQLTKELYDLIIQCP